MLRRRVCPVLLGGPTAGLGSLGSSPCHPHAACDVTPAVVMVRRHRGTASSGASRTGASFTFNMGDYYSTSVEEEQDKVLEEEEFTALNEQDGDDYLPFVHRLAKKADAMDAELRRLRWELLERRQLLMDTKAATMSGRPTNAAAVIAQVVAQKQREAEEAAAAAQARKAAGSEDVVVTNERNQFASGHETETPAAAAHTPGHRKKAQLTNLDFHPYMHWAGVPSVPIQLARSFLAASRGDSEASRAASPSTDSAASGKELATLTDDLDYLRRIKSMHALNYYSRMILTPKRHIGHGLYQVLWNGWLGLQNAFGAVCFNTLRGIREYGAVKGTLVGAAQGCGKAAQFLFYGWVVSPLVHVPRGICNSFYGPLNFFHGRYFFDATAGRWMRCTVLDGQLLRHSMQREKRVLRTVGRAEFRRKKMAAETKWSQRLASMGFSMENLTRRMQGTSSSSTKDKRGGGPGQAEQIPDPYQTLGVRRTATQQQIKQQYKKLAMVFHPDIVGGQSGGSQSEDEKNKVNAKFEQISSAYQILSNPEKRKAYDQGGAQGLSMHEGKFGQFMSRTPEQMVQSIFGGEGFRRLLIGDLLRSHWSLRYEAQVSVSLHEFEELQCMRVRQVAMELAAMVDVHAKRPSAGVYYKNVGTAAAPGAHSGRSRMVHSSSLPDPFGPGASGTGTASTSPTAAAAAKFAVRHQRNLPGGRAPTQGKTSVMDKDLKENIMEELGDKPATQTRRQAPGKRGVTNKAAGAASSAYAGAAAAPGSAAAATPPGKSDSPYVLVPGSNEYNCFSKDFEDRCDKFVGRLSGACFGPELLNEVGEAYVTNAQRFLRIRPFYASKQLMNRKIAHGIDRIWNLFLEKTKKMEKEEMAKRVVTEYFNMEYDNVVADMHVVLRFATQLVLQDCTESEEVRRKRCYAVWYLGERMRAKGSKWDHTKRDDAEIIAYIQQAATSSASTSKPHAF